MRKNVWCLAGVTLALVVACGSTDDSEFGDGTTNPNPRTPDGPILGGGDGGPTGDGSVAGKACNVDGDCGAGGVCNPASKTCGCGGARVAADLTPPNLLVVLDRSCSMTDKVGGKTKWEIAVAALTTLTTKNTGKIRFGLELFPDRTGNNCQQDAIPIPVGPGKEAAINKLLNDALVSTNTYFPNGPCVTNIDTAMQTAKTEPAFADKTRRSFAILMTDGQQAGCSAGGGDNGTTQFIKDLKTAGVDTFVIGFGSGVDVNQMNAWAVEGGQPKSATSPKFFDAADATSLQAALDAIAKKTLGCTLKLGAPPPGGDVGLVNVFVDKSTAPLPRDTTHGNNWDYDPATQSVTFYGAACTDLKDGKTQAVNVVFGCPGGPPPENPVK